MELEDFIGKPCSSRAAFEFLPKRRCSLNLAKISKALQEKGVYVEVETPHILMLKLDGSNISLSKNCKILVKETGNEAEARNAAEKLISKIE